MSTSGDRDQSSLLDQLYDELGRGHAAAQDLEAQQHEDLAAIDAEEKRLTAELAETEAAGDTAKSKAIEQDLDRMREAFLTIKDQLGEDEQQDGERDGRERDGDGDGADGGHGSAPAGADDRGDGERRRRGADG